MNLWQNYLRAKTLSEAVDAFAAEAGALAAMPESARKFFAKFVRAMRASPPAALGVAFDSESLSIEARASVTGS